MQAIEKPTAESTIDVSAPPDVVWRLIADVTRTPEWSPVCYQCEWTTGGGKPVAGARFRGFNRLNRAKWSRECVVTEAEPARIFAFSALFKGRESTRWRYRLDGSGSTTTVSEAYEIVLIPPWLRVLRLVPGVKAKSARDTEWNISSSLQRIKAIAEDGKSTDT
jgi:uncharacterized protein YndB with AHSA1/START domain